MPSATEDLTSHNWYYHIDPALLADVLEPFIVAKTRNTPLSYVGYEFLDYLREPGCKKFWEQEAAAISSDDPFGWVHYLDAVIEQPHEKLQASSCGSGILGKELADFLPLLHRLEDKLVAYAEKMTTSRFVADLEEPDFTVKTKPVKDLPALVKELNAYDDNNRPVKAWRNTGLRDIVAEQRSL